MKDVICFNDLDNVIPELQRIRKRLHQVETLTRRKRTDGRAAEIEAGDDLSGFRSLELNSGAACGIDLRGVARLAIARVDDLLEGWK